MTTDPDLLKFVQFSGWADARLLAFLGNVEEETVKAEGQLAHGSVFDTLLHLLDSQWSWRRACEEPGFASPPIWEVEDLGDLTAVAGYWASDSATLESFVSELTDSDLERLVQPSWHESSGPYTVKQILFHVLHHAATHRSEISSFLSRRSHTVGDLEFMNFLGVKG